MKPLSLEEIDFLATQPITDRTELGRINLRLLHTAREYHRLREALGKRLGDEELYEKCSLRANEFHAAKIKHKMNSRSGGGEYLVGAYWGYREAENRILGEDGTT